MINVQNLNVGQLRKVIAIKEEIERLEAELATIGGAAKLGRPAGRRRRKMSAAAKARIAAAQRARWAKVKRSKPAPEKKTKRKVDAATRARLAAVARARWAKVKAAGKSAL